MTPSALVLAVAGVAALRFGHALRAAPPPRQDRPCRLGPRRALRGRASRSTVAPLVSPLAGESLAGHMLEHVLIADAAVALLVLAVRGPLLFFLLPPLAARSVARRAPLRRGGRAARAPVGRARAPGRCAYAGWHVPAAYDYAVAHEPVHALEHATFVAAGVLVWTQLVDPAGRRALSVDRTARVRRRALRLRAGPQRPAPARTRAALSRPTATARRRCRISSSPGS